MLTENQFDWIINKCVGLSAKQQRKFESATKIEHFLIVSANN
jgi:hypothetical protein